MLSEEDFPFLEGWIRKIEKLPIPALITKNNTTTVIDLDFIGFFQSAVFEANDSNITLTLSLNQAEQIVNIQDIYNYGFTRPNSALPYIGAYSPTNGTAGFYTVIWSPSALIPVKRRFYLEAILDQDSTQNTAAVGVGVVYYLIYDETAFLTSLKNYLSYILPKATSTSKPLPPPPQPEAPTANKNNIYNPFANIP